MPRPTRSRIVKIGHPALTTPCQEVQEITKETVQIVSLMKATLLLSDNGVGLAANQIGRNERIFIWRLNHEIKTVINPILGEYDNAFWEYNEGCLSVPGHHFSIWRPKHVLLRGLDLNGDSIRIDAIDLEARIFLHEMDHLNGKLVIDHLSPEERTEFMGKLKSKPSNGTETAKKGKLKGKSKGKRK